MLASETTTHISVINWQLAICVFNYNVDIDNDIKLAVWGAAFDLKYHLCKILTISNSFGNRAIRCSCNILKMSRSIPIDEGSQRAG